METGRRAVVTSAAAVITAVLAILALAGGILWLSIILFVIAGAALITLVGAWLGDVTDWVKGWRSRHAKPLEPPEPAPAFTSLWRSTMEGLEAPSASNSFQKSVQHPGYARLGYVPERSKVVLSVLMACAPLGDSPGTTELVSSWIDFLNGPVLRKLASTFIEVGDDLAWHSFWSNGRLNNQAILAHAPDDPDAPIATAILNLNDDAPRVQHFQDPLRAELILTFEPEATGIPFRTLSLAEWHEWLVLALKLPELFASYLAEKVQIRTFDDPPAVVGVYLQASTNLTDMIDTAGLQLSAAMTSSRTFPTYLVADRGAKQPSDAAVMTLRALCDHGLHALDYERQLGVLTP